MSQEALESAGGESPTERPSAAAADSSVPVFVSYSSQDVAVAETIVKELERHGLACWIAPRNVTPGEFYADSIVRALTAARVFVLLLTEHSANSQHVLREIERASSKRRAIVTLRIGSVGLPPAFEYFLSASHWLDANASDINGALPKLVEAVQRLVSKENPSAGPEQLPSEALAERTAAHARVRRRSILAACAVGATAFALAVGIYFFRTERAAEVTQNSTDEQQVTRRGESGAGKKAVFSPPPHSVAVLPFVNLSGDPKEQYFSDGLSEELVHTLARIDALHVAARTSSSALDQTPMDVPAIGRKLNVGTVLEGSVRRWGTQVRITAQLIDALSGYHLWSQTFDRPSKDILILQTEIAAAVAGMLRVTLLADPKHELTVGGTANPKAFDAYLRARYSESIEDEAALRSALAAVDEAIALDRSYANAYAFRSYVLEQIANVWTPDLAERQRLNQEARTSAEKAVAMAPESGLAHAMLGDVLSMTTTEYTRIDAEYRQSIELEPGNAQLLNGYASYAAMFGRPDALVAAKRAVSLDPFGLGPQLNLGVVLFYAHQFAEARAAFQQAFQLRNNRNIVTWAGLNEVAAGNARGALDHCERKDIAQMVFDQVCLAMAYHKLNRPREAEAILEKLMKEQGDSAAYQYAQIYASWGRPQEALVWLAKAERLGDSGLLSIKADPFLDSLHGAPEFQALVARLHLPT